ncbi:MAG: tetratricopeptide repeat protein, partial [Verrucomicrobiota bacterium]
MISAERIAEIESLLGGGNYGAAIHVLQELLAADPGDPLLLNKLAHAHLRKGELRQANKCFHAAGSALEGALIPIYSGRAEVETRLEHGVEAAFWARKAIALRHQQTMQRSSLFRQPVWKASKS